MESRLSSPLLPEDKRKEIETELTEIKKLLETNTELLSKLHKENSKSFVLVAIFVFISFLLYGLWAMWYNGVK
jgi:Coiled-coil domain-containing protein 167